MEKCIFSIAKVYFSGQKRRSGKMSEALGRQKVLGSKLESRKIKKQGNNA